ncbi:vWA domain-containing protein [Actinosynnema mirum]|uniref:Putative metallopeptidase domain-containing protein n=1 Tax=Actinosynnema mirum (strain ATCC 29888 / DSM 43827 / JCM 3225 / NBRC 14064 / NCIMB 13271 / NRRL B-12336 / IMRU 3971 / 101) TaxID=446462 RepID=C6WIL4_ACTMD|nr:hypothetical protein [Actinosynnema mirum]ACU38104.1 hypothetical protein Amir_4249 [Actinosynnema mirum DSM 43827]
MSEHSARRHVVDLADRRALLAWNPADPEVVAEAGRLKDAALLDFGLTGSPVASWLFAKCRHQVPTTAVPTAAVVASGDGSCLLLYNPGFFVALGLDGVKFVLFHEARHLVHRHLFVEPELAGDPVFTLAAEVAINHVALIRLGRDGLPEVDGRPVGVDPGAVHERYRADLAERGLEPLDYRAFAVTDLGIYRELKRMAVPVEPAPLCVHQGEEFTPLDQGSVDALASSALLNALLSARRGNRSAESEVSGLVRRTDGTSDSASRRWAGLGAAGQARARTSNREVTDWWQRWLVGVLGSLLSPGERLVYPRKRGAVLAALGHDPVLARVGPVRERSVVIALDASGSLVDGAVAWMADLVGRIDGARVRWLSFDTVVMPFAPGQAVRGGGGTDFQAVVDHVEGRSAVDGAASGGAGFDEVVDAVIVLTDGFAPPVTPAEPDKWIWLITPDGDDWPDAHRPRMACHRVRPVPRTGQRT